MENSIAKSSIEEGLDFACNLVAVHLNEVAFKNSTELSEVLQTLTMYINLRYVGELELALEYLSGLGTVVQSVPSFRARQFWTQLSWVAQEMGISTTQYDANI